jgi:hypothetical protein
MEALVWAQVLLTRSDVVTVYYNWFIEQLEPRKKKKVQRHFSFPLRPSPWSWNATHDFEITFSYKNYRFIYHQLMLTYLVNQGMANPCPGQEAWSPTKVPFIPFSSPRACTPSSSPRGQRESIRRCLQLSDHLSTRWDAVVSLCLGTVPYDVGTSIELNIE